MLTITKSIASLLMFALACNADGQELLRKWLHQETLKQHDPQHRGYAADWRSNMNDWKYPAKLLDTDHAATDHGPYKVIPLNIGKCETSIYAQTRWQCNQNSRDYYNHKKCTCGESWIPGDYSPKGEACWVDHFDKTNPRNRTEPCFLCHPRGLRLLKPCKKGVGCGGRRTVRTVDPMKMYEAALKEPKLVDPPSVVDLVVFARSQKDDCNMDEAEKAIKSFDWNLPGKCGTCGLKSHWISDPENPLCALCYRR